MHLNCFLYKLPIVHAVLFFTSVGYAQQKTHLASKQIFNLSIGAEVASLDPHKITDNVSGRVDGDLFEGLVTNGENGNIEAGIAKIWNVSADGLVYTFHLRPEAKFSDGSFITAQDVVFSIRRVVDPKVGSLMSDIINMIQNAKEVTSGKEKVENLGVKAVDKNTVQISLNRPTPFFVKILTNILIVQKENVLKFGDNFAQPGKLVSSGAYVLKYWKIGDKITAARNENYWNNKETAINVVNYFPVSDENTELQMYRSGQIDFTHEVPSNKFAALKRGQIAGITAGEVHVGPYLSTYYIDFNYSMPPFKNNPKLRQALSMAVDRNIIVQNITGRGERPAYDLVPYGVDNYKQQFPAWAKDSNENRIADAKRLYKEAGYSAENPLKITYFYDTNVLQKKVAVALAAMWEKNLGVKMSVTNMEYKVFLSERQAGKYQTAQDYWTADYDDPVTFLYLMKSTNPQNNAKYANPKYDALLAKADVERNPQKRARLLQQASSVILKDAPIAVLYTGVTTHLIKPYLGGYLGKSPLDRQYSKNYYIIEH